MNKRQKKKTRNKIELFVNSFCFSYKEVRILDRLIQNACVIERRRDRKCKDCEYYKMDILDKVLFYCEPCSKGY